MSLLVMYGKTALINFISKSFNQNGIYCSGWFQLEFVPTVQCKMIFLTCWSETWRCTRYKGHSVYTPVRYSSSEIWVWVKARQIYFETRQHCFWKLKEMLGPKRRTFVVALPRQNKTDFARQKEFLRNTLSFWRMYCTSHFKWDRICVPISLIHTETAVTHRQCAGTGILVCVCVHDNSDLCDIMISY